MRARLEPFSEVFRAPNPAASDEFHRLCERLGAATEPRAPQEFLVAMNLEVLRRLEAGDGDATWAVDLCAALAGSCPEVMVAGFGGLVNDGVLSFQDPIVAVVFEAAGQAPALLELLAELVDTESYLLQFRIRAMEAVVTRLPGTADADAVGLEAQSALRFLNGIFEELDRGPSKASPEACAKWAEGFSGLSRLFPETEGGPEVLAWVAAALAGLGDAPLAADTMRTVLRVLRANTPQPSWHAAHNGGARDGSPSAAVGALIVDKAVQVVLATSGARWRPAGASAVSRAARPTVELWPFNERVLEAALVDQAKSPRVRAAAAGLLHVLTATSPSARPSATAAVYADLFLGPYRRARPAAASGPARQDSEDWLDPLLEATADACLAIRHAAVARCTELAVQHPSWFEPRHYTKLLPLLSNDDPDVRAEVMKTFQALAGFRSRQVATVVGDIAARIRGEGSGTTEPDVEARGNLEIALGITMDRLVDDVEQLQREVQVLEARRGELLQYIETQAIRVGEEIHHEVLNTLTGYLATAIDEGNYAESRSWLDALIQELRRIMNNLYPRDLETEGFLQTIGNRLRYAKAHLDRRGRPCEVRLDCAPEITDAVVEAHAGGPSHVVLLYRIVVEAISNARKHAGGTAIAVSLRGAAPGGIEISISDNGPNGGGPFSENAGMALMRRRAEEIGAAIDYARTPGGGTTVVIRLAGHAIREEPAPAPPPADVAAEEVKGDGEARPAT
jgi:signal transduction histidine kinase